MDARAGDVEVAAMAGNEPAAGKSQKICIKRISFIKSKKFVFFYPKLFIVHCFLFIIIIILELISEAAAQAGVRRVDDSGLQFKCNLR